MIWVPTEGAPRRFVSLDFCSAFDRLIEQFEGQATGQPTDGDKKPDFSLINSFHQSFITGVAVRDGLHVLAGS